MTVQPIPAAQAAELFRACPDPLGEGATDLHALADRSACYLVKGEAGTLAMALQMRVGLTRDVFWINAAAGQGANDWTRNGLAVAEFKARECRAHAVGFQTARRGLVRRAQAQGYRLAGFILLKDLP